MEIERKCLTCFYCAEEDSQQVSLQLIGQKRYMCLAAPPSASAIPVQGGGVAAITSYPQVNGQSISCARFTPIPPVEVRAQLKKGKNDE